MFTGLVRVERLQMSEVNDTMLRDVNQLLITQRHDARPITQEHLLKCMEKMGVVLAWNDNQRVVGLGVLTLSGGLNFSCAEIRHLVVNDGRSNLAIGMRIVRALCDIYLHVVDYTDAGAWVQDEGMKKIFTALGFKEKPGSRFRLRKGGRT
ncbi:MAG: hypothetical protein Q7K35_02310 [bacterium]|nr:hypothetical protein [bacterium]